MDLDASAALTRIPYFEALARRFADLGFLKRIRNQHLAASVRLGPRQLPHLWGLHRNACDTIGIDPIPELFLTYSPFPNAFTVGVDKPIVVVHSSLVDICDDAMLLAILAHEAGHIHSGHMLNKIVLNVTAGAIKGAVPFVPGLGNLGELPLRALHGALLAWDRGAEMSCDRVAGLVTRDVEAVSRALVGLAVGASIKGIDIGEFINQSREYQTPTDPLDFLFRTFDRLTVDHPVMALRIPEFSDWATSGAIEDILAGRAPRPQALNMSPLPRAADRVASLPSVPRWSRQRPPTDLERFDQLARDHMAHQDKEVRGSGMTAEEMGARIEAWLQQPVDAPGSRN